MSAPLIDPLLHHQLRHLRLIAIGIWICLIGLHASAFTTRKEARYIRYVPLGSFICSDRYFRFTHGSGGWAFEWASSNVPLPAGHRVIKEWQFDPIGNDPVQWLPQWRYIRHPPGIPIRLFIPLWIPSAAWAIGSWYWIHRLKRRGIVHAVAESPSGDS